MCVGSYFQDLSSSCGRNQAKLMQKKDVAGPTHIMMDHKAEREARHRGGYNHQRPHSQDLLLTFKTHLLQVLKFHQTVPLARYQVVNL